MEKMKDYATEERKAFINRTSSAQYMVVETQPGIVWLIDCDAGGRSVTNDAERVVRELNQSYPGCRFIYRDSEGKWDELMHDNGRLTGFAPARHLSRSAS